MTVTDLTGKVEFIVDSNGNKKAVVVDFSLWEEILDALDQQHWDHLFAKSPDLLAQLGDEAKAERLAGRTQALDPDRL